MLNGYRRMFRRQDDLRTTEIIDTLKQVALFQGFSRGTLRDLAVAMHGRVYRREEVLYYEHDPGLGLYVVQRGRVRLLAEDDQGGMHELRQAGAYEVFGTLSLLGDFRRMETAQAVTETHVLGFFRPDLNMLAKRNPKAGLEIVSMLARYVAARQVELMHLFTEQEGKISAARLLHGASRRAGRYDPDGPRPPGLS